MKVLSCARNEASALQHQLTEAENHEGSLEFLIRVQSRLETLSIAVLKTKRNEPEVVTLKREVLDKLEDVEHRCEELKSSVSHLLETSPVAFCSGALLCKPFSRFH